MSNHRSSALRRSLRRLSDPDLIGWQFFLLSLAAWSISFYPQVIRGGWPFTPDLALSWIVSILGGQIALFAFLFLAKALWLRTPWAQKHPAVTVWTFIVGTIIGVIAANAISGRSAAPEQGFIFGVEHVVFGVLGLCVIGSIYISFRNYRADVAQLAGRNKELQMLLASGEKTLSDERLSVRAAVADVIEHATSALDDSASDVVERLTRSSETLLRPLSHELAANSAGVMTAEVTTPKPRWRNVLAEVTTKPLIAPLLTALTLLVLAGRISFNTVVDEEPQVAFDAAGNTIGVSVDVESLRQSMLELGSVFAGTYIAAWIILKLTQAPLARASLRGRLIITVLSAFGVAALSQLLVGLLFSVFTLAPLVERTWTTRLLALIPIAAVAILMGLVRSIEITQRDVKNQLQRTNDELTWQVARINEEIWDQRRTLAHIVHGPIRAALISSAIEISQAGPGADPNLRRRAIDRLTSAQNELITPTLHSDPLEPLRKIQELWKGTCAITLSCDESTLQQLQHDPVCANVTMKVVEEACANAIMHAHATTVGIEFNVRGDELHISVTNNGSPPLPDQRSGLGTAFIADVTLAWQLIPSDAGAKLIATLPTRRRMDEATTSPA